MAVTVSLGRSLAIKIFAPSSLCIWSQMPWRNLQIRVLPQYLLHELLKFDGLSEFLILWIGFSENHFDSF